PRRRPRGAGGRRPLRRRRRRGGPRRRQPRHRPRLARPPPVAGPLPRRARHPHPALTPGPVGQVSNLPASESPGPARKAPMHVCLFDIDGTLISSGGAGKAALEAALAGEFGITRLIDKLQLSGRTDRAILLDLLRMHVIEDTPENWRRLIDAYLKHLPDCLARCTGRILPGIAAL